MKRNHENDRIGTIIRKWLLTVMIVSFVVLISGVTLVQIVYENTYYYKLLTGHVADIIGDDDENISGMFRALAEYFTEKIEPFRDRVDSDYLTLEVTANEMFISELNIVDEKGIIIFSSKPEYIGYDMRSGEQSAAFLCLLSGTDYYEQDEVKETSYSSDEQMAYAGMAFTNGDGFIQVGFDIENYNNMMRSVNETEVKRRHIGLAGSALVCDRERTVIYSGDDEYNGRVLDSGLKLPDKEDEYVQTVTDMFGTPCYVVSALEDNYYIIAMLPTREASMFGVINRAMMALMAILIFLIMYLVLSRLLNKHVVKSVEQINTSLLKITEGDLEEKLTVNDTLEFRTLSTGINEMVGRLKEMFLQAQARIEEELQNAKIVQTSSLPSVFPPYPDRKELEIYATMNAAKVVGGDFYDFFFTDLDHFVIVMADVSDKGVPAAMFMMRSKACIRAQAMSGKGPAQILLEANGELYRDNDSGMFVTVWLAIIELSTGRVVEGNAGHTYPAIFRNASFALTVNKHSLPLGMLPDRTYTEQEYTLAPQDVIFVYTDGVTEAENADGEFFGDDRLVEVLNTCKESSCEKMVQSVREAIGDYVMEEPQHDDITMCAFRYLGGEE